MSELTPGTEAVSADVTTPAPPTPSPPSPGLLASLVSTLRNSRRGVRDTLLSMAPQGVSVLTGLGTSILVARGLGAEGLGLLAIIQSLSGLAMALTDLGIGSTAVRYASRAAAAGDTETEFAVLRWAFRLRMSVTALVTAVFFAVGPFALRTFWDTRGATGLLGIALCGGIFLALSHVPTIFFQARHQFGRTAVIGILQNLILFGGIVYVAVVKYWSVGAVLWSSTIAAAVSALAFLVVVPKRALWSGQARWGFRDFMTCPRPGDADEQDKIHTFAWYYFLSAVVVMVTMRLDVWMLGVMVPKGELGVYSVATRFTLPLTVLLAAINTALWPRASAQKDRRASFALLKRTFKISLLAAGAGLVYSVVMPLLAPVLFGEVYRPAILLGQLLCARYCVAIAICPVGIIGYSFGLVKSYWWINLLQMIVAVLLNLVLIPRIGAAGAAATLVATDVLGFVVAGNLIVSRTRGAESVAI